MTTRRLANPGSRLTTGPVFAGVAGLALLVLGNGPVERIPLTHPNRLWVWWTASGPVVGAFALMRLAFMLAALYWFSLGVIAFVFIAVRRSSSRPGRWGRPGGSLRLVPGFTRTARAFAGTSLAGAAFAFLGGAPPSFADTSGGPTGGRSPSATSPSTPDIQTVQPRLIPLGPRPVQRTTPDEGSPRARPGAGQASLSPSARSAPTPTPAPAPMPTPAATPAPSRPGVAARGGAPATAGTSTPTPAPAPPVLDESAATTTWAVRPGDDLWSIAESVVTKRLGRAASDAEIGPYWLKLIATNRSRLPDPGNPSLIFAGELMALPPL